jgi:hypothetical protein
MMQPDAIDWRPPRRPDGCRECEHGHFRRRWPGGPGVPFTLFCWGVPGAKESRRITPVPSEGVFPPPSWCPLSPADDAAPWAPPSPYVADGDDLPLFGAPDPLSHEIPKRAI